MSRWARRTLIVLCALVAMLLGSLVITAVLYALGATSSLLPSLFGVMLGLALIPPFTAAWDRWGE